MIRGCANKDPHHQRQLMEYFARRLMTTCRRYFTDAPSCKDVLQEVFIKAFRNIEKQGEQIVNLEGWMHRICVNECLLMLRRRKMKIVDLMEVDKAYDNPIVFDQLNMEEIILTIQQLPVQYRTIFNLIAIDGYDHQQVASMLNITPSTSRSNYSRARKKLQELLIKKEITYHG